MQSCQAVLLYWTGNIQNTGRIVLKGILAGHTDHVTAIRQCLSGIFRMAGILLSSVVVQRKNPRNLRQTCLFRKEQIPAGFLFMRFMSGIYMAEAIVPTVVKMIFLWLCPCKFGTVLL